MKSFLRSIQINFFLDRLLTCVNLPTKLLRRLIPPPVYYQPGKKRTYISAGCVWHLDLSDHVQREIAVNSLSFARQLTQNLCQHGHIVVDAGANRGNYCIPLAKSLKGILTIHAFEPNPNIYKDLEHHVERNTVLSDHLIIKDIALGKQSGSLTFR